MSQASLYSQNINFVFTSSSVPVAAAWSKGPFVKKAVSRGSVSGFQELLKTEKNSMNSSETGTSICSRQNLSRQVPHISLDPNPWWDLAAFNNSRSFFHCYHWMNRGRRPEYWAPNSFASRSYLPMTPKLWVQRGHPSSPDLRWRSCRWRWTTGNPGASFFAAGKSIGIIIQDRVQSNKPAGWWWWWWWRWWWSWWWYVDIT